MNRAHSHAVEPIPRSPIFDSFFMAGFECSTHIRRSGQRLDLVKATKHDKFALEDYERIVAEGMRVAREGVRWHLVEANPGQYDFSSVVPIVEAARHTEVQIIWDLCHFGWPDHLDIFKPNFVYSLARYGAAFARWLADQIPGPHFFVPINEISYFSWASGDEGSLFPFVTGRGFELKTQLVRSALENMDAIWRVSPSARFVHVDPIIHVVASPKHPEDEGPAEAYRISQFQAWDMISGKMWPELGGHEKYLDIIGVNFYPQNQWFYNLKGFRRIRKFVPLKRNNPRYRPLREMLNEVYQRYGRPMVIAETGAEDELRAEWFRYVCGEAYAAIEAGVPLHGCCLYPILNHPGWVDDRHCHNALWDYPDEQGKRKIYAPLARELRKWRKRFDSRVAPAEEENENELEPVRAE